MRMMGFGRDDMKETPDVLLPPVEEPKKPVRSLVRVRFEDFDRELAYFNDRFDLSCGDRVFVSGKLAGKPGFVTSVTTKFKIKMSDYHYEKVIALAQTPIHGAYKPVADKMLSYDSAALSPEAFRTWVLPPEDDTDDPDDEVIYGDGYEIPLDDPHRGEEVEHATFERALEYCRTGKIGYVSVRNGIGRAFVQGSKWYELEFRIRNNAIEEAYCDCPFPGLCKHLLAVAIMLSVINRNGDIDLDRDFVLIDKNRFFEMIKHNGQTINL